MKIYSITPFSPNFKGTRQDRRTVSQLKEDNKYDLNVINQRRISQAIDNLSKESGENNVNFLLDVADNLKYGTSIDLGKSSFNDWHVRLNNAAKDSLAKSPKSVQEQLAQRIAQAGKKKPLTDDEKEILALRKSILSQVNQDQLDKIKNNNIKNLNRNLDYFIVSSEVPTSQKLYIMTRLNHFMSPEYKINPALKDKKTQALAEIVNDIVVDTPESKIPNIKAINQKHHGMCAAISICRKALAYEDKPNFVDMIMSELDDKPYMEVYDITKLGSGTKIPIGKTSSIDFDYALARGYRIIDTSALYWMNIADSAGSTNEFVRMYSGFDKTFFDTFHDAHFNMDINEQLANEQDYYKGLLKAKNEIGEYKKQLKKEKSKNYDDYKSSFEKVEKISQLNKVLETNIAELAPNSTISASTIRKISSELRRLEMPTSAKIAKSNDYKKEFLYLPNESDNAKLAKIKSFIAISLPESNSDILDKNAPKILELLESISELEQSSKPNYLARKIREAQSLYGVAAAYRTQAILNLEMPENAEEMLRILDIPDRETRIDKNINMLIKKLKKNKLDPRIMQQLAKNFQCDNDSETLIVALEENKNALNYIMTDLLDDFYNAALQGNRKEHLSNELRYLSQAIEENRNKKNIVEGLASNMHIKNPNPQEIVKIIDRYIQRLNSEDCTNEEYLAIYNKVGKKNQMQDYADLLNELYQQMFVEKNEKILTGFKQINGIPETATPEETLAVLNKLIEKFNNVSHLTTALQVSLEVRTPENEILNTVDTKETVIKKLANLKEIIPAKDLRSLQEKFTKIENARTSQNGEHTYAKDLPKELTTFTPTEQETLDLIKTRINSWNSTVTRAFNAQYKKLQEPLEELSRQIGVKNGETWSSPEGHSGLVSSQEVKIIEHMTDRPYYIENNIKYALNKIKNIPYSGISSTSVDHKQPAMHAQYIADIKPVEVKTEDGKIITKDALFHDNTWGPTEHENTWVDENGLLRTDYNNEYGGRLGYITDDKYRNGNLLENVIGQVGVKQYQNGEEYKYPMAADIITPGKSPSANSYTTQIRQNALVSPIAFFEDLVNLAQSMPKEDVLRTINKTRTLTNNFEHEYQTFKNRVFGNPPFDNGIKTQADYDKLPDTDKVKLVFEKIALLRSYSDIPDTKILYKDASMKDLQNLKKYIHKEAMKNFDYTFGKNMDVIIYGAEKSRNQISDLLNQFAKDNNIKINANLVIKSMKNINKNKFDGNTEKTINLMIDEMEKYFDKSVPNFDNKDEKVKELANQTRNIIRNNTEFTLADLNSSSFETGSMQRITKWIDDTFAPTTDEEFVQIFNNLRKMTSKEFHEKYDSKITDDALGIKNITGFDILSQFRGMDERTENSVMNMLYYPRLGQTMELSKTTTTFNYKKFKRVMRGAIYSEKRSFDDIYMDYYFSLKLLNRHKMFNPYKAEAFRKYNVFPVYPKIDLLSAKGEQKILQNLYDNVSNSVDSIEAYKTQAQSMKVIDTLSKYVDQFENAAKLTDSQVKHINKGITKFLELNGDDASIKDSIDAAKNILNYDGTQNAEEYKKQIKIIYDEMKFYSTSVTGKSMKDAQKDELASIQAEERSFVTSVIDPKYQHIGYDILNKWKHALMNKDPDADRYFTKFQKLYEEHKFVNKPEQMLNEYLLMIAKQDNSAKSQKELKEIENIEEVYAVNLQNMLLMSNLLEIQYILMDTASEANQNIVKDKFKNSQLVLTDGRVVGMDSDEGISAILAPLLADEDLTGAITMIEQLGLTESVINMVSKHLKMEKEKFAARRIDTIYSAISRQTGIIQKAQAQVGNLDNDPNYLETINKTEDEMIRKFKNTRYRKSIKYVKNVFDQMKTNIAQHPEQSKHAYFQIYMEQLKTILLYGTKQDFEELNQTLKRIEHIQNLVNSLKIPEGSPLEEKRKQFNAAMNELGDYVQKHTREYKNLNIKTKDGNIEDDGFIDE